MGDREYGPQAEILQSQRYRQLIYGGYKQLTFENFYQLGRARKDKYLRHGTKVRMRGQLLGDAERKDARWRLGKACSNIERRRAAEAKRAERAGAHALGPRLYALAPCHQMVYESDMIGNGKAIFLTTGTGHPCCTLRGLSHGAHEAVSLVVPMQVTGDFCSPSSWVEESSTHGPGPVSKPILRTIRALGGGAALVALGGESCFLLAKIVQDQLVVENAGLVVLVQPDPSVLRPGALGALAQLNVVLILSKSVAHSTETRQRLLALLPHASLSICDDSPAPNGIELSEVGQCIGDLILKSMGCDPSSSRTRYEDMIDFSVHNAEDGAETDEDAGAPAQVAASGDDVGRGEGVEEEGEEGDGDEEEEDPVGMFEIVLRPSGGGGRGDTGTKMSVMMLADEDVWDDDMDEIEESDGELGEGGENEVGDERDAHEEGEGLEGGEIEEGVDSNGAAPGGVAHTEGLGRKSRHILMRIHADQVGEHDRDEGRREGHAGGVQAPAGGRVVFKGGGMFIAGGAGEGAGEAAAQRRAQEDGQDVVEGMKGGGGEGGGTQVQKWAHQNRPGSAQKGGAHKSDKKRGQNKAMAVAAARARERMRGERIGR